MEKGFRKVLAMHGKKPTYNQRKILVANKLDTYSWLVQKDDPEFLQVIHKDTGEEKIIKKLEKVV